MTSPTYPIVGLHGGVGDAGPGAIPLRYEIQSFVDPMRNKYALHQLNLFLQAVERMQNAPKDDLLSWFQVAGEPIVALDSLIIQYM